MPTATITGERSTIAGTVKSHSAGRSTTLTRSPAALEPGRLGFGLGRVVEGDEGELGRQVGDDDPAGARDQPRLGVGRLARPDEEDALPAQAEEDRQAVHRLRPSRPRRPAGGGGVD